MRNIDFVATLDVRDESGAVTGTRQARVVGRVYGRAPTEDNSSPWQLHDYRAFVGDVELTDISGADGDAITAQAESFATNNEEGAGQ